MAVEIEHLKKENALKVSFAYKDEKISFSVDYEKNLSHLVKDIGLKSPEAVSGLVADLEAYRLSNLKDEDKVGLVTYAIKGLERKLGK